LKTKLKIDELLKLYQSRNFDKAEKIAISLSKEDPNNSFAWKVLGLIYLTKNKLALSLEANKKALKIFSNDPEIYNNMGNTLSKLLRYDQAKFYYQNAINIKPDFFIAYYNLANLLKLEGKLDEAIKNYQLSIRIKPDYAEAHFNLGNSFKQQAKFIDAEKSYKQAIFHKPNFAEAYHNLGVIFKEKGEFIDAEKSCRRAISLKSDYAEAYHNLGVIQQIKGELENAKKNYQISVKIKPDYAESYRHLALVKKFNTKDNDYLNMKKLYLSNKLSKKQRCHICFGLAKANEDMKNIKKAFDYYQEGNSLRKKELDYHINEDKQKFERLKLNFEKIFNYSLNTNEFKSNIKPIFIVGMPRSGTTLIEQIISSHPDVLGGGELPYIEQLGDLISIGQTMINLNTIIKFRNSYLEKIKPLLNNKSIITDKMPQNFRYIGLISVAFPEAKIIHVKRNAAAVCWSNYKQYFSSNNIRYNYSMNDVVEYYKLYNNLMRFWKKTIDNEIYDIDYDLLTTSRELSIKKLINHLGLNWNNSCLFPENNNRIVLTASNLQIRKHIYKGSSQKYLVYEDFFKNEFKKLDNL
jgi:tetratricopeptide (TPR) repeat protein